MLLQKFLKNAGFSFGYDYSSINSVVDDKVLFGNSTVVAENKNWFTFFVNNRDREWYDHNNDNYSELPILKR